jgi:DNA-binding transcriptional ArsR family regulator
VGLPRCKVLKDETRRKIVLLLNEKGSLSYTDLMKALEIDNTGRMNYHLKVLGGLVMKREDGQIRAQSIIINSNTKTATCNQQKPMQILYIRGLLAKHNNQK